MAWQISLGRDSSFMVCSLLYHVDYLYLILLIIELLLPIKNYIRYAYYLLYQFFPMFVFIIMLVWSSINTCLGKLSLYLILMPK